MITDAEGNANTQIKQIQSMIDADVDAIVLIAGSATALDRVVADACERASWSSISTALSPPMS